MVHLVLSALKGDIKQGALHAHPAQDPCNASDRCDGKIEGCRREQRRRIVLERLVLLRIERHNGGYRPIVKGFFFAVVTRPDDPSFEDRQPQVPWMSGKDIYGLALDRGVFVEKQGHKPRSFGALGPYKPQRKTDPCLGRIDRVVVQDLGNVIFLRCFVGFGEQSESCLPYVGLFAQVGLHRAQEPISFGPTVRSFGKMDQRPHNALFLVRGVLCWAKDEGA